MELKCIKPYTCVKFSLKSGDTTVGMELPDARKKQMLADFPESFEVIGKKEVVVEAKVVEPEVKAAAPEVKVEEPAPEVKVEEPAPEVKVEEPATEKKPKGKKK